MLAHLDCLSRQHARRDALLGSRVAPDSAQELPTLAVAGMQSEAVAPPKAAGAEDPVLRLMSGDAAMVLELKARGWPIVKAYPLWLCHDVANERVICVTEDFVMNEKVDSLIHKALKLLFTGCREGKLRCVQCAVVWPVKSHSGALNGAPFEEWLKVHQHSKGRLE